METTRLGLSGYGVKPYSPFDKALPSGHPVGVITRLGLSGFHRQRNGSFAGKAGSIPPAHPVGVITRLGLSGFHRERYGLFDGKTEADTVKQKQGGRQNLGFIPYKEPAPAILTEDDEEVLAIIMAAVQSGLLQ